MKTLAPSSDSNDTGMWNLFEANCGDLISVLASVDGGLPREDFSEALSTINSTLSRFAWSFLRSVSNFDRRNDLTEEAVQIWHQNMLAKGFRSYALFGNGRPFTPYAIRSLRHICVSLLRGVNRLALVASPDEFSGTCEEPHKAVQCRELERDCQEFLDSLPVHYRKCLRLLYFDGLSGKEAAKQIGVNPRTLAVWHLRARQLLAAKFRKRGHAHL
jgi:RNA polymerase sigma factor (sigma-70 family)